MLSPPGELVDRVIPLYGGEHDILFFSDRGRLMDFISLALQKRIDLEANRK